MPQASAWESGGLGVPPQYAQVPPRRSRVFFRDARGGCGKTHVLNALLAAARMHKVVGLAGCFTALQRMTTRAE